MSRFLLSFTSLFFLSSYLLPSLFFSLSFFFFASSFLLSCPSSTYILILIQPLRIFSSSSASLSFPLSSPFSPSPPPSFPLYIPQVGRPLFSICITREGAARDLQRSQVKEIFLFLLFIFCTCFHVSVYTIFIISSLLFPPFIFLPFFFLYFPSITIL